MDSEDGPSCWLGMSPVELFKMLEHGPVICTKDSAVAWVMERGWAESVPNRDAGFKIRITDAGRVHLAESRRQVAAAPEPTS